MLRKRAENTFPRLCIISETVKSRGTRKLCEVAGSAGEGGSTTAFPSSFLPDDLGVPAGVLRRTLELFGPDILSESTESWNSLESSELFEDVGADGAGVTAVQRVQ